MVRNLLIINVYPHFFHSVFGVVCKKYERYPHVFKTFTLLESPAALLRGWWLFPFQRTPLEIYL